MSKRPQDLGAEGAEAETCGGKMTTEDELLQVATPPPLDHAGAVSYQMQQPKVVSTT